MRCIVHGVTKSRTQLSDFHFQDGHSEGLHENGEKKKQYLRGNSRPNIESAEC